MFHRILIAIDASEPAEYAVEAGIDLALKLKAEVALLHVVPPMPTAIIDLTLVEADSSGRFEEGKQLLAEYRRCLPKKTQVEEMVVDGLPSDEIVAIAKDWNADLIVLGTHNRHGISRFILGSTAETVLRRAPCPVLVVRHKDDATTDDAEPAVGACMTAHAKAER
jgi:nucleotide-binding universal stress UspA family protein